MEINMQVGPQFLADGVSGVPRIGRSGDHIVSELHGKYYEQTKRGNVFFGGSQAAITFTTLFTTTVVVGLVLSNPINSGKDLVLLYADIVPTTAVAAVIALGVMPYSATAVTHTTALTPRQAYGFASAGSVANLDTGATLPAAATVVRILAGVFSTATTIVPPIGVIDLGGSLVLPPGTAVAMYANAGVAGFPSFTWEEVPV